MAAAAAGFAEAAAGLGAAGAGFTAGGAACAGISGTALRGADAAEPAGESLSTNPPEAGASNRRGAGRVRAAAGGDNRAEEGRGAPAAAAAGAGAGTGASEGSPAG